MAKKKDARSPEQRLQAALVPESQWPYQIPENWCFAYLNAVYQINPKNNADDDVDAAFIPMEKIAPGMTSSYTYDRQPWKKAKKGHTQFADGDVAFAKISPCFENRKSMMLSDLPNGIGGGTTELIILRQPLISQKYTFYFISNEQFLRGGIATYSGTVGQQRISMDYVREYPFPLPPLSEQQRIVDRIESLFAKLDEAKQKARDVLDSFETRKAAILHKAFTGKLSAKWRTLNFNSNTKWFYKTLNETSIEIIDGDRGPNYPKKEEFSSEGYCVFLNTKNVTKHGFSFDKMEFITAEKDAVLRKGKLVRDDIVLTTRGTIGNIAYYDESIPYDNIRINSGMVIYRNGNEFYKPFLIWLYKSDIILDQIKKMQTGSAQPQLPIKIMKELQLPIPSFDEQKEIVRILDDLLTKEQQAKEAAESVLEQIDLIKKSILARAFRGELGTNDPTEESAVELLKDILK